MYGEGLSLDGEYILLNHFNIDKGLVIEPLQDGTWTLNYPVRNLGEESVKLSLYDRKNNQAGPSFSFSTYVEDAQINVNVSDEAFDDKGPTGNYTGLQHSDSIGQMDILNVSARSGGDVLEVTLTMRGVTNAWNPTNGFDNVSFSLFFNNPNNQGLNSLPQLKATMPRQLDWDFAHVAYGWGNTTFTAQGASENKAGFRLGTAPTIIVNKELNTITFVYDAKVFDLVSWDDVSIYITTWDISGEGALRSIDKQASDWIFGGGTKDSAKILDDAFLEITYD